MILKTDLKSLYSNVVIIAVQNADISVVEIVLLKDQKQIFMLGSILSAVSSWIL
jgi:hypothetical protein